MANLIEYNGEMLTINAIAKKEGIVPISLRKAYQELKDIDKAIEICKKNQEMRRGSIEYYGKKLTIAAIAKMEDISEAALSMRYKKIGNIYEAVEICKKNREIYRGNIEYNGEFLSMEAIAKVEDVSAGSLARIYTKTGNIHEAVKICKRNKEIYRGNIEYNGEILTIRAIAIREGVMVESLRRFYKELKDIYKAIEKCKENQLKHWGSIEYNGETLSIHAIAKREGIVPSSLKRTYEKLKDIYKAVFICKNRQIQRERDKKKIKTKFGEVSLYDLSLILGIKYSELKNLLNKGHTVDEIVEMDLKPTITKGPFTKVNTTLPNGQSLKAYCVENGLNYSCIYRAINTYGKSLSEAEEYYKNNGQQIPTTWIYEKYGLLLRHIMLKDKIDIDLVVKYMREGILSMEEAVEKYVIRKNAKKDKLDQEWMEELYGVLTDNSIGSEYDEYKKQFYVDDKEETCIIKSYDEVEGFKRKLLLFEISDALKRGVFTQEEEAEVLKVYNVTPSEIETIFLELYSGFNENGVLMGENQKKEMTEERDIVEKKIQKYKEMISGNVNPNQDADIIAVMKSAVGKNVETNEQTREEIRGMLNKESNKEI